MLCVFQVTIWVGRRTGQVDCTSTLHCPSDQARAALETFSERTSSSMQATSATSTMVGGVLSHQIEMTKTPNVKELVVESWQYLAYNDTTEFKKFFRKVMKQQGIHSCTKSLEMLHHRLSEEPVLGKLSVSQMDCNVECYVYRRWSSGAPSEASWVYSLVVRRGHRAAARQHRQTGAQLLCAHGSSERRQVRCCSLLLLDMQEEGSPMFFLTDEGETNFQMLSACIQQFKWNEFPAMLAETSSSVIPPACMLIKNITPMVAKTWNATYIAV